MLLCAGEPVQLTWGAVSGLLIGQLVAVDAVALLAQSARGEGHPVQHFIGLGMCLVGGGARLLAGPIAD